MFNLKNDTYLKLIFVISLIALIFAYFIEYALGHKPCNLCLIERIPYGLGIIIIIINFVFSKNQKLFVSLLILIFIFSLTISIYHFGIEQGFFAESSICGLREASEILSKEELLKQLQEKTVSCKDVTFKVFGFSLTTFNIFLSLIFIIILTKILKNNEKFKN